MQTTSQIVEGLLAPEQDCVPCQRQVQQGQGRIAFHESALPRMLPPGPWVISDSNVREKWCLLIDECHKNSRAELVANCPDPMHFCS